jgi:hypothetical protein
MTLADFQGTSTVPCGDDLKSELGGLPTEPVFGKPDDVCFKLAKDTLCICLFCAQQVEHSCPEGILPF